MEKLKINPKFENLLPRLSDDELKQLEESILNEGCNSPIIAWNSFIVDGHNRYNICTKHDLPFAVIDKQFADEDAVMDWMFVNQLGRRNLTSNHRTLLIGRLYNLRKNKRGGDRKSEEFQQESKGQSDPLISTEKAESVIKTTLEPENKEIKITKQAPIETAKIIAKEFSVSPKTVKRAATVAAAVEVLPAPVQRDYEANKITHKQVVEKAKVIAPERFTKPVAPPAPTPENTETDAFTELAARHGRVIHQRISALQDAIKQANNEFAGANRDFNLFASNLARYDFSRLTNDAQMLKTLRQCPKCHAEECGYCEPRGYLNEAEYMHVKRVVTGGI